MHIGAGCVIRPGVVIDGPAYIGDNSVLGPNCWIRPYTTIGRDSLIGQGTEIKDSVVMDGVFAAKRKYIGDSEIGEGCYLGAGAATDNSRHDKGTIKTLVGGVPLDTGRVRLGAMMGDGVQTGIHSSFYPGRKIWPGLHTLPGCVIRKDLTE